MDIRMPVMDGIAATYELLKQLPTIKVLVLTTFDDDELVRSAIAADAAGYVLKGTPAEDLADLIKITRRGYLAFAPGLMLDAVESISSMKHDPLQVGTMTIRERDVLRELAVGSSNKRIASKLCMSEGILSQLGLSSRTEAALAARSILDQSYTIVEGNL